MASPANIEVQPRPSDTPQQPLSKGPPLDIATVTTGSATDDHNNQYSLFTARQKSCISWLASWSAMYSGLSSFIYYPAISALSHSLGVTVEMVNLSITSYQAVSGIAPAIMGDLADQFGRRPISLLTFIIYFGANIGLALQNNYTALMILRAIQSAGASSEF